MVSWGGLKAHLYRKWMDYVYYVNQLRHLSLFRANNFSASQEDLLISEFLPEAKGSYIDIGAGHPISGSNTFFFYKRGWSGICVEPFDFFNKLHKLIRSRDLQIKGVVDAREGTTMFYQFNPNEYSTINREHYLDLLRQGMVERRSYEVETRSLSTILKVVSPIDPYFVSIDVEGHDYEILSQLTHLASRPRVICVEETISTSMKVKALLESLGYSREHRTGNNGIYVHRDYLIIK